MSDDIVTPSPDDNSNPPDLPQEIFEGVPGEDPRNDPSSRLTVVEHVYHEPSDDAGTNTQRSFSRKLKTNEQPFVRKTKAGSDWRPLATGSWLEDSSMLVLSNDEGGFQRIPTPEEKRALEDKILEVAVLPPPPSKKDRTMHSTKMPECVPLVFALVHPGETLRFTPADLSLLHVRSKSSEVKMTLTLLPL